VSSGYSVNFLGSVGHEDAIVADLEVEFDSGVLRNSSFWRIVDSIFLGALVSRFKEDFQTKSSATRTVKSQRLFCEIPVFAGMRRPNWMGCVTELFQSRKNGCDCRLARANTWRKNEAKRGFPLSAASHSPFARTINLSSRGKY
jgi:hypothetical protein